MAQPDLDYAVCDISNEENIDGTKDNRQRHADLWRTDKDDTSND